MGMQMNEHGQRWEEQRERLSAYLDGRLSSSERAALERHIADCARCRAELEELRQVVALLSAMPAPRLPRSFTLPETAPRVAPAPVSGHANGPTRRGAPAWAQVARWAGGLAAAAGFVLLVGNALAGIGGHFQAGGASTAASQSVPASSRPAPTLGQPTDRSQNGTPTMPVPSPTGGGPAQNAQVTATAGVGAGTAQAAPTVPHTARTGQGRTGFAIEPVDLPIAGAGLLVAGAAAFTVGSVARRRTAR